MNSRANKIEGPVHFVFTNFVFTVSSPRPGAKKVEEELEALQHDLAVIGQIAGLVATLRKSHEVSANVNSKCCSVNFCSSKKFFTKFKLAFRLFKTQGKTTL